MRVPQVTERMKEAPAHALRAVFAGIGQVLLVADRIKNRATEGDGTPPAAAPESPAAASATAATGTAASPAPPAAASAAPAPPAPPAASAPAASTAASTAPAPAAPAATAAKAPAATAAKASAAAAAKAPAARPAARTATAKAAAAGPVVPAGPAGGDLPLPGYDELSVPSLRARMRSLNPAQLRALADYERAHEGRDAVLAMFERRIAKVEGGEA
jgi:cytoskeletal protein RodZ